METWKEFIKAVLSRKFAIAFVGILALYFCYTAYIQSKQLLADEEEIVSVVSDPNDIGDKISKTGPTDWLIPTYIVLLAAWTVGVQGYLDYRIGWMNTRYASKFNKVTKQQEAPVTTNQEQ